MDSAVGSILMRLSDLRNKPIRTLDGNALGRVHEVHCEKGVVTALMCGSGSLIERWTARQKGRRIPWEWVRKVEADQILVSPVSPQQTAKKVSASRSRQGTRRPTARPSKR